MVLNLESPLGNAKQIPVGDQAFPQISLYDIIFINTIIVRLADELCPSFYKISFLYHNFPALSLNTRGWQVEKLLIFQTCKYNVNRMMRWLYNAVYMKNRGVLKFNFVYDLTRTFHCTTFLY